MFGMRPKSSCATSRKIPSGQNKNSAVEYSVQEHWRASVHAYEIRIFRKDGSLKIVMATDHFSDKAAIHSARKFANGQWFEVWKGLECLTGVHTLGPSPSPPDNLTAA
jgi:hypothetical protein